LGMCQTLGGLVLFALLAFPMIGAIDLGVDITRAVNMRAALQANVDTAALSGAAAAFGSTNQTGASSDSPNAVGQSFYKDAGIPPFSGVTAATTAVTVTGTAPGTVTVKATATAQIQSLFSGFMTLLPPISATATAVASSPSGATGVFPFALPECAFSTYWNAATGQPIPNSDGTPQQVTFDSVYHSANNCTAGQWTSLNVDDNSQSGIKALMNNGCGCTLKIGEDVYIQPGTKAARFGDANKDFAGKTVLMVVLSQTGDITVKASFPILSFVPFHIVSADQGAKTITGFFVSNFRGGGLSGSGGTNFGAVTVALTQ
ncbi:MAG: hypothetical protein QOJ54_941, partial [Aliidongia sp.]|nr:hypothetical protein [Aliidongia sp.]